MIIGIARDMAAKEALMTFPLGMTGVAQPGPASINL